MHTICSEEELVKFGLITFGSFVRTPPVPGTQAFNMRYPETCNVMIQGRQSMVYPPVRSIIHSLKLVDYLSVQAHKPRSISHIHMSRIALLYYGNPITES